MVADDPNNKIDLKALHCEIINDHDALKREEENYNNMEMISKLDNSMVQCNYFQVKQDIQDIIQSEMERLMNNPALKHLVIKKEK